MDARLAHPGQRRAKRLRVYYVAQLAALGRDHRVKLLDVSPRGALVESGLALEEGDEVELIRGGLRLATSESKAIAPRCPEVGRN